MENWEAGAPEQSLNQHARDVPKPDPTPKKVVEYGTQEDYLMYLKCHGEDFCEVLDSQFTLRRSVPQSN